MKTRVHRQRPKIGQLQVELLKQTCIKLIVIEPLFRERRSNLGLPDPAFGVNRHIPQKQYFMFFLTNVLNIWQRCQSNIYMYVYIYVYIYIPKASKTTGITHSGPQGIHSLKTAWYRNILTMRLLTLLEDNLLYR